jgi:hypothetical protein
MGDWLMIPTEHPTEDSMEELIFQRLPIDATHHLLVHILQCDRCQELFEDTLDFVECVRHLLEERSCHDLPAVKDSAAAPLLKV